MVMTERQIKNAERKAKAIDLLGGVCANCGAEERLEFDHIGNDRENYKHTLSNMWDYAWDKIVAELKKCQLLCRHCHAIKSMVDRGFLPSTVVIHGTSNAYVNRGCRCEACTKANADKMRNYYRNKRVMA